MSEIDAKVVYDAGHSVEQDESGFGQIIQECKHILQ